jgi:hypothetical protein
LGNDDDIIDNEKPDTATFSDVIITFAIKQIMIASIVSTDLTGVILIYGSDYLRRCDAADVACLLWMLTGDFSKGR